MTDDGLKAMLDIGLKEYTEEALSAARAELARRGKAEKPIPAVTATAAVAPPEAPKPRRGGTAFIIVGAFFIYATVLFAVLAAVRSNARASVDAQLIFQVIIYALIAFFCLRAGARRKENWQNVLGVGLLVFGGLAYASLTSLAARRPGTFMGKVIVPTVIVLAALGVLALAAGYIKKSYKKP